MAHNHYFPEMLPVEGETYVASGKCKNCGATRYFVDYVGQTRKDFNLKKLIARVNELNTSIGGKIKPKAAPVPPKPEGKDLIARHNYYIENATAIMSDFRQYGVSQTLRRWKMSGSAWKTFRREHQVERLTSFKTEEGLDRGLDGKQSSPRLDLAGSNQVLDRRLDGKQSSNIFDVKVYYPDFPSYSGEWPIEIKAEWFRTYSVLVQTTAQVNNFIQKVKL